MKGLELRYRQVHLDFHTSPDINGIAKDFDPEEFAKTLDEARVNSITCFARCHHGMLYYDSKLFPERIHPHLVNKDFLKEQIEACHKRGIRVPIYITVQWDQYTADEHPEWLALDEKGHPVGTPLYEPGFYRYLCVNTPYRDFLKALTKEILETFPTDGLFFDIVQKIDCSCKYCRSGMEKMGLDPSIKEERLKYAEYMIKDFMRDMTQFIRQYNKNCSIFYNKGHVGPFHRDIVDAFSHLELESLPGGSWGYMHFPIAIRYARNLGLDCLGQTGKFHTSWGDFHSFKNKAALEFECFRMLALNSKCLIGDQLEPNGRLSKPVYELIGSVYSQVEKKEPWCKNAKALTDIGVLTTEEFYGGGPEGLPPEMIGVSRMLQEGGHQFDVIDTKSDLTKYKVIVLPDRIPVSGEFAKKLKGYISNGGSVIASFKSGIDLEKDEFALNEFGVKYKGMAQYSPDFIVPSGKVGEGLHETEHVMYMQGLEVEAQPNSEVLCWTKIPYFNRTWRHFCSHKHTPSSGKIGYPGIVKNGNCIYFMHPIFAQYDQNAPRWCKKLFLNALDMLLLDPLVRHGGPSTMMVTINEQAQEKRYVLHLLHYIPERRSKEIDIIEDVIPLYNIEISLKVPEQVKGVRCVPEGLRLDYKVKDGRVVFTVPEINGHLMVELRY